MKNPDTAPYLRCDVCGRKQKLSTLTGEPGLLLFCSGSTLNSLLCSLRARRNRRARS